MTTVRCCLLSGVGLDGVQEVSVSIFGADQADPVQGGVVCPELVGLHLGKQDNSQNRNVHIKQPVISFLPQQLIKSG